MIPGQGGEKPSAASCSPGPPPEQETAGGFSPASPRITAWQVCISENKIILLTWLCGFGLILIPSPGEADSRPTFPLQDGHGELVFYDRPNTTAPKLSHFTISPTDDPGGLMVTPRGRGRAACCGNGPEGLVWGGGQGFGKPRVVILEGSRTHLCFQHPCECLRLSDLPPPSPCGKRDPRRLHQTEAKGSLTKGGWLQ